MIGQMQFMANTAARNDAQAVAAAAAAAAAAPATTILYSLERTGRTAPRTARFHTLSDTSTLPADVQGALPGALVELAGPIASALGVYRSLRGLMMVVWAAGFLYFVYTVLQLMTASDCTDDDSCDSGAFSTELVVGFVVIGLAFFAIPRLLGMRVNRAMAAAEAGVRAVATQLNGRHPWQGRFTWAVTVPEYAAAFGSGRRGGVSVRLPRVQLAAIAPPPGALAQAVPHPQVGVPVAGAYGGVPVASSVAAAAPTGAPATSPAYPAAASMSPAYPAAASMSPAYPAAASVGAYPAASAHPPASAPPASSGPSTVNYNPGGYNAAGYNPGGYNAGGYNPSASAATPPVVSYTGTSNTGGNNGKGGQPGIVL